jgi:hypothetical protein
MTPRAPSLHSPVAPPGAPTATAMHEPDLARALLAVPAAFHAGWTP